MLLTLAIVALLLMIGSFIYLGAFHRHAARAATYVPAHVDEQGNFIPGRVVR